MVESPRESLPARALDRLIAWSEDNPFVHAAIIGEGIIVDPVWRVEHAPRRRYQANGWVFRVQATDAQRRAAARWAESRIGQPYGIAEILADGARLDLHLGFVYRLHPRRFTCSGFVAAAYAAAGVQLTHAPLPSPADLSFSPLLLGRRPWDITAPPSGGVTA